MYKCVNNPEIFIFRFLNDYQYKDVYNYREICMYSTTALNRAQPNCEIDWKRAMREYEREQECSSTSSGLWFWPRDSFGIPLTIVVAHGRVKFLRDEKRWRTSVRKTFPRTIVPRTSVPRITVPTMAWLKALPVGKYNTIFFRRIVKVDTNYVKAAECGKKKTLLAETWYKKKRWWHKKTERIKRLRS